MIGIRLLRQMPLLWLLVFLPAVLIGHALEPKAYTVRFVLWVLVMVPLAALLTHPIESVAVKTRDSTGKLVKATLGNLTELVIGLTALRTGEYAPVKALLSGAIV